MYVVWAVVRLIVALLLYERWIQKLARPMTHVPPWRSSAPDPEKQLWRTFYSPPLQIIVSLCKFAYSLNLSSNVNCCWDSVKWHKIQFKFQSCESSQEKKKEEEDEAIFSIENQMNVWQKSTLNISARRGAKNVNLIELVKRFLHYVWPRKNDVSTAKTELSKVSQRGWLPNRNLFGHVVCRYYSPGDSRALSACFSGAIFTKKGRSKCAQNASEIRSPFYHSYQKTRLVYTYSLFVLAFWPEVAKRRV